MRVPVKMVENKAYSHTSPNTVHKLGAVVISMQESSFYPLDVLSEDDMVALEAEVKRSGEYSPSSEEEPVPKGVSIEVNIIIKTSFTFSGLLGYFGACLCWWRCCF